MGNLLQFQNRAQGPEGLLRYSEERLRLITDLVPHGIFAKDSSGRHIFANPALAELAGLSVEQIIGKDDFDLVANREEAEAYRAADLVVMESGKKMVISEEPRTDLSGRTRFLHTIKVPFTVPETGEQAVLGVCMDITERRQTEESLALFRNLVDGSPDAIEVIDPETGQFLDVNTTGCKRLGYSREEMLALKLADIDVEKDYRTLWPVVVEEIKKAGFAAVIGQHRRKDGTTFPVEVNARYINLNRGYMVAVVRDITERKRIESRFRLLVDSNVQGVLFWTRDGKIFGANDSFLKLVHYTREDLEAGRINWMELTPPEFAHLDRRALEEITATGVCTPYEKEFILTDGSRVPVFLGSAAFKDNPDEGVAFVLDLTERKKLEQQFLRAQRMESIGTLAGGVAHDLNNILAPIMMSIHLLKGFADDPEAKDILETIEASAKRGADIVKQVLSFARGLEGERVEVQPKHLIKDLETIIKDTFPRDIRLQFSVPNNAWMILGDATQIHQILLNLCINARDAMPGGGSLTIGVENCTLDEHYAAMNSQAKAGRHVLISVTDSGTGMPPELLDKIFEPFFTTKERGQGTGLGLSTVFAIVKSHGGFINVYSEVGKGTNFKIYLPASETPSDEQRKLAQQVSMPRGKGETVLVIDDEPSILNIAGKTLQSFGYKVLTATDGADGMAVYLEHKNEIAVVLTDMMMPIMDGPATIHALTRIDPNLKIIAASGLNTHGEITKVTGMGIKHFLTKPYTAAILLKTLRAILDKG
jgi:PAS domain S-box-containing protein